MDRYFLILASFRDEDEDEGINMIKNLLDFLNNNCNTNVDSSGTSEDNGICQTRGSENYYWSLIVLQPKCSSVSYTTWSKMCPSDTLNEELIRIIARKTIEHHRGSAADAIHCLCDKLPLGPYLVDLIWIVFQSEDLPDLDESIELFGAFSRLIQWHQAKLSFCCCRDETAFHDKLVSWIKLFPIQIVSFPFHWKQLFDPLAIWRGALHLVDHTNSSSLWVDGFQLVHKPLVGMHLKSLEKNQNDAGPFQFLKRYHMKDGEQHFFSGCLTMAGKIPLTSIPPHAIADIRFELILPQPMSSHLSSLSMLDTSWEFMAQANSEENVCHILQLGIFSSSVSNNSNPLLTTKEWKRRIVNGQSMAGFKDTRRQAAGHCFLILVGNGSSTPHTATVFMLRSTDDYNPKACQALSHDNAVVCNTFGKSIVSGESFLDNLPILTSKVVSQLENIIQDSHMRSIYSLVDELNCNIPESCIREFARSISSVIFSRFKEQYSNDLQKEQSEIHEIIEASRPEVVSCKLPSPVIGYLDDDPALWPEKIFLKGIDTLYKCNSSLEHLAPFPQCSNKDIFLNMDQLVERLQSNKQGFFHHSISPANYVGPSLTLLTTWPSAKHCDYHDIYYNKDRTSEVKQQQASQLQARYIACDTASSFQHCLDEPTKTVKKQPMYAISMQNPFKKVTVNAPVPKTNIRHQERRKEMGRNFKSAKTELSEMHLKKLRIAVVDALEMHGIHLESALFKTCAKKLYAICLTFAKDVVGEGRTSKRFKAIAESHVQQVINFETNRPQLRSRKIT